MDIMGYYGTWDIIQYYFIYFAAQIIAFGYFSDVKIKFSININCPSTI